MTFEGEAPKADSLSISEAGSQGCCEPGAKVDDTDRSQLIDENGGIANVVIALTFEGAEVVLPSEPVVVELKGCRFEPHLTVVHVGTSVSWEHSDAISHNIHIYTLKNEAWSTTVPPFSKREQTLMGAEAIRLGCDIHPWMESYVYVTEATHFTLTGTDGSFKIEGVPPGEYKLEIWHERLGKGRGTVTVNADGSSEAIAVQMRGAR